MTMISYARTDTGRARKINQDYVFTSSGPIGLLPNLLIVADGMGGHKAGDFASRFAVEQMVELAGISHVKDPALFLRVAIEEVNSRLHETAKGNPDLEGTGTTLVAAVVEDGILYTANVGDSRLYLLREELQQITRDHSLVEEMVSLGKMERDSESYRSQKNIITRAVGTESSVDADVFVTEIDCADGAVYVLLCSDGLTNHIGSDELASIITSDAEVSLKADTLVSRANSYGGTDNITAVVIKLENC